MGGVNVNGVLIKCPRWEKQLGPMALGGVPNQVCVVESGHMSQMDINILPLSLNE